MIHKESKKRSKNEEIRDLRIGIKHLKERLALVEQFLDEPYEVDMLGCDTLEVQGEFTEYVKSKR